MDKNNYNSLTENQNALLLEIVEGSFIQLINIYIFLCIIVDTTLWITKYEY